MRKHRKEERIHPRYTTGIAGVYNKAVNICPHCGNRMPDTLLQNCRGVADSVVGRVLVIECDKCHECFFFHSDILLGVFIDTVEAGENVHIKKKRPGGRGYRRPETDEDGGAVCMCTIPHLSQFPDGSVRCSRCRGKWYR